MSYVDIPFPLNNQYQHLKVVFKNETIIRKQYE